MLGRYLEGNKSCYLNWYEDTDFADTFASMHPATSGADPDSSDL